MSSPRAVLLLAFASASAAFQLPLRLSPEQALSTPPLAAAHAATRARLSAAGQARSRWEQRADTRLVMSQAAGDAAKGELDTKSRATEVAVVGGGCFWCTEAIFLEAPGILSVTPGYAGGKTDKPTYQQVVSGKTGHAEVIRVEFDPSVITLAQVTCTCHAGEGKRSDRTRMSGRRQARVSSAPCSAHKQDPLVIASGNSCAGV